MCVCGGLVMWCGLCGRGCGVVCGGGEFCVVVCGRGVVVL